MIIVVKENIYMLGRRPLNYYKILKNFPRVFLISPEISSLEIIQKSEIIATISGTAAWEGVILNKKVLVLGDSPYIAFSKSIIKENAFTNYTHAIKKLLDLDIIDSSEIIKFIDCCLKLSFKLDSGLIWRGRYDSFSEEEKNVASNNFIEQIQKYYEQKD